MLKTPFDHPPPPFLAEVKGEEQYLRDTLRLPAKGLAPLRTPYFIRVSGSSEPSATLSDGAAPRGHGRLAPPGSEQFKDSTPCSAVPLRMELDLAGL